MIYDDCAGADNAVRRPRYDRKDHGADECVFANGDSTSEDGTWGNVDAVTDVAPVINPAAEDSIHAQRAASEQRAGVAERAGQRDCGGVNQRSWRHVTAFQIAQVFQPGATVRAANRYHESERVGVLLVEQGVNSMISCEQFGSKAFVDGVVKKQGLKHQSVGWEHLCQNHRLVADLPGDDPVACGSGVVTCQAGCSSDPDRTRHHFAKARVMRCTELPSPQAAL